MAPRVHSRVAVQGLAEADFGTAASSARDAKLQGTAHHVGDSARDAKLKGTAHHVGANGRQYMIMTTALHCDDLYY